METNKSSTYTVYTPLVNSESDKLDSKEALGPGEADEPQEKSSQDTTSVPMDVSKSSSSSRFPPQPPNAVALDHDYHGHSTNSPKSKTPEKRQLEVESPPSLPSKRLRTDDRVSADDINSRAGSMSPTESTSSSQSLHMDVHKHAKDSTPKTLHKHAKPQPLFKHAKDSSSKTLPQPANDSTAEPLLKHAKDSTPKILHKHANNSSSRTVTQPANDSPPEPLHQHANDSTPETLLQHETRFQCSVCAKAFRFESRLLRHKNAHRRDSRRPVNSVQSGQPSGDVSAPEISLAKDRHFPCGLCSERFSSSAKLEMHMVIHSGFSCDKCGGLAFASNAALRRHLLKHSEKPKKSKAAKSSATKKSTKSHSKSTDSKSVQDAKSSATKKSTKSRSKSSDSKSVQKGQPSAVAPARAIGAGFERGVFPCNLCDKVFSRPAQLKFHMIVHSNVGCVLCDGLTFTSNEELRSHLITHSGQRLTMKREKDDFKSSTSNGNTESSKKSVRKRVYCSVCNKDFARPCYLRKHMVVSACASNKSLKTARRRKNGPKSSGAEGNHESPRKVVKKHIYCSECNKGFSGLQRLWKHMVVLGCGSDEPAKTLRSRKMGPRSSSPKESVNSSTSKKHKSVQIGQPKGRTKSSVDKEVKSVKSGQAKRSNKPLTSTEPLPVSSRQPKGRTKSSTAKELMPARSWGTKKSNKPSAAKEQMSVASGQLNISASAPVGSAVEDKPFPCLPFDYKFSQLGLTFPSREQLSSHMLTHAMQLKCPLCDAVYACQNSLLEHFASHSDPVPHICEICSSTFHSQKSLKMHQIMDHSQSKLKNIIESKEKGSKEKSELVKKKKKQRTK